MVDQQKLAIDGYPVFSIRADLGLFLLDPDVDGGGLSQRAEPHDASGPGVAVTLHAVEVVAAIGALVGTTMEVLGAVEIGGSVEVAILRSPRQRPECRPPIAS